MVDLKDGDTTILKVAEWFLHKKSFTHKQLQKLCYYVQAWHCALLGRPLFAEEFQARIHERPKLYSHYADFRWNKIPRLSGTSPKFSAETTDILRAVYNIYSQFDGAQLKTLTHSELP